MTTRTTSTLAPARTGSEREASSCDVCPHALAGHDRIAERYCRATVHGALSRGCVCSPS